MVNEAEGGAAGSRLSLRVVCNGIGRVLVLGRWIGIRTYRQFPCWPSGITFKAMVVGNDKMMIEEEEMDVVAKRLRPRWFPTRCLAA
jgi:hypothetical protein